jgi:hypothetical protein
VAITRSVFPIALSVKRIGWLALLLQVAVRENTDYRLKRNVQERAQERLYS